MYRGETVNMLKGEQVSSSTYKQVTMATGYQAEM